MIKTIPKFDGSNIVQWTRSFNDILQMTWPYLSKIVSRLDKPESIPRENKEEEKSTSDFNDSDSNPSKISAHGSPNSDKEPVQY